jgi:hypothetical protein
MLKSFFPVVSLLFLAACSGDRAPINQFRPGNPVLFEASNLDVIFKKPVTFTDLSGKATDSKKLKEDIEMWAVSTFVPSGNSGNIFVIVEDVYIKEVRLNRVSNSLFKKEPISKFEGKISVRVEVDSSSGKQVGGFAQASASVTVNEGMSFNDRQHLIMQLSENMIADLDNQIRSAIDDGMAKAVK